MHQTFEFTKFVHGEQKKETVMMLYPKTVDIAQIMHTLGLAYCISPEGTRKCPDELTFAQFMERITPEILAHHQIQLVWPSRDVIQMDEQPPIVSSYELQERRSVRLDERIRLGRMRDAAERFARRLERQRANGHPAISTWETDRISGTAVAWAGQFVTDPELDMNKFFEQQLRKAKPSRRGTSKLPKADADTSGANAAEPAEI